MARLPWRRLASARAGSSRSTTTKPLLSGRMPMLAEANSGRATQPATVLGEGRPRRRPNASSGRLPSSPPQGIGQRLRSRRFAAISANGAVASSVRMRAADVRPGLVPDRSTEPFHADKGPHQRHSARRRRLVRRKPGPLAEVSTGFGMRPCPNSRGGLQTGEPPYVSREVCRVGCLQS